MNKIGYSIKEVCNILGICHSTVYQEINSGELESIKIQSRRIVTEEQLKQYVKRKQSVVESTRK